MTGTQVRPSMRTRTRAARAFAIMNGVVFLGVLVQGLSGGSLLGHLGPAWARVHQITAVVVIAAAVACAVLALVGLRGNGRGLLVRSVVLLGLIIVQTALGESLHAHHALLAVHVPVAMLIMALSALLAVRAGESGST